MTRPPPSTPVSPRNACCWRTNGKGQACRADELTIRYRNSQQHHCALQQPFACFSIHRHRLVSLLSYRLFIWWERVWDSSLPERRRGTGGRGGVVVRKSSGESRSRDTPAEAGCGGALPGPRRRHGPTGAPRNDGHNAGTRVDCLASTPSGAALCGSRPVGPCLRRGPGTGSTAPPPPERRPESLAPTHLPEPPVARLPTAGTRPPPPERHPGPTRVLHGDSSMASRKPRGRSVLARVAQFQTSAGHHGGTRQQQARRRRQQARQEARAAERLPPEKPGGGEA